MVVPMKLKEISRECAEAQARSKALAEEMIKMEEKRLQAKANAASLAEVMSLRISDKGSSKSESLIWGARVWAASGASRARRAKL